MVSSTASLFSNTPVNPWRGIGQLPKGIWVLCGTTLINRAGTMALPFLVVYLTKGLGYSAAQAGFVLTLYGAAALLSVPLAGRLSDAIGPLRVMKSSLWLTALILAAFPFARTFPAIIIATICWSMISDSFGPASLSIISEAVSPGQRKIAFSANRLAANLGMSIGPAVGGLLIHYSFSLLFWVNGASSFIAGFVLWLTMVRAPSHRSRLEARRESRFNVLHDRQLLLFVAGLLPIFFTFFQIYSTLPYVCVEKLGLDPSIYGLFFTINTVLIILLEVPLNIAMARWQHRHAMALGGLLVGVGFGGMVLASEYRSVIITVVIWTFGEMILLPSSSAFVADIAPPSQRGSYMGVYQMTGNAALALSAWFGMKYLEMFGARALWGTLFLASTGAAILFLRLRRQGTHFRTTPGNSDSSDTPARATTPG
jgi:predicted MFS family arabinose efflux permease